MVCLEDSLEDKFSGMKRTLPRLMSIGMKVLMKGKLLGIDSWMIWAELMLEQLSFEKELLGGESLSL